MIPDTEIGYTDLRRFLFGALARLARQGLIVPPDDAADIVHDFFVEVWPAVVRGYDPNRGKLEAYSYRAFVHFARPRIVRLRQWRSRLVKTSELARLAATPARLSESTRDTAAVADALAKLPPLHRDVLHAYLASDLHSERALSEAFGLSRYRLRETLVEALGRVAVLLGEPGRIRQGDWEVARALWKEGRTSAEAGVLLGRTTEEVRQARERIGMLLSDGLRQCQPTTRLTKRRVMMSRDVQSFLKEVLASPGSSTFSPRSGSAPTRSSTTSSMRSLWRSGARSIQSGSPKYTARSPARRNCRRQTRTPWTPWSRLLVPRSP